MLKFLLPLLLALPVAAHADESAVRNRLLSDHPQLVQLIGKVEHVNKSPIPGLYEVVTQDSVYYTDKSGNFLINGNIWDLRNMHNLTAMRENKLFAVAFNKLPFDLTFKEVKGNGKRKLLIFTDPNCHFCKLMEGQLKHVNNVTIYRLMYPIFDGSDVLARNIWCSKNRLHAWKNLMLNGVLPPHPEDKRCTYDIRRAMGWGKRLRINGTPALVFSDGTINPGALPAKDLDKALDLAAADK